MNKLNFGYGFGYSNLDLYIKFNNIVFEVDIILHEESSPDYDATKTEHTFTIPSHDTHAIIYFSSGRGEFTFGDETFEIKPGAFFFKPAFTVAMEKVFYADHPIKHTIFFECTPINSGVLNKRELTFQETIQQMSSLFTKSEFQHGLLNPNFNVTTLFDLIHFELNNEQYGSIFSLSQLILNVFLNATRSFQFINELNSLPKSASKRNTINHIRFLVKHYYKTITLDELAKMMKFSRRQLQRYFKTYHQKTFREVLDDYRIRAAKERIRDYEETFAQIAEKIGYKSFEAFTKSFILHEGISPEEFRDSIKHKDTT